MSEEQLRQYRTRLREATAAIEALRGKLAAEQARREPLAIVGMGCRFPQADGPEAFWSALTRGVDGVREIPGSRWPRDAIPGDRPEVRWAGLLDSVDGFDAGFFGVSPREAERLDPQQRLLLEVAWEALEDAGTRTTELAGSQVGVFAGLNSLDHQHRMMRRGLADVDAYTATGNLLSTASGRISYSFGFEGPCVSIDTACSSSLVAVALACQSLRAGECEVALAGGVTLLLSPYMMALAAGTQALAPDGRCKVLDARANGFVRGEGCGLVVLKRLADARRDGDVVRAVIRGWAINQDGRSTGLTAPNVRSQAALLRTALTRAEVAADEVGYVEMHGTGTPLGDPIETEALRAVFPARADGSRCVLGAVKSNVGHLEAAAGVAGLIKTVLALEHGEVPRNLHFRRLNPRISLVGSALSVAEAAVPWGRGGKRRIAGVSSFGISGTNVHVVVEEGPEAGRGAGSERSAVAGRSGAVAGSERGASVERSEVAESERDATVAGSERGVEGPGLFVLSARSEGALAAGAGRLRGAVGREDLRDLAVSLATTRSPLEQRLAIVASSRVELEAMLAAAERGELPNGATRATAGRGPLALLFTGQGAQAAGMGQGLYAAWPAFRAGFDECAALFDGVLPRPLRSVMWAAAGSEAAGLLDETMYTQAALFTLGVALAGLWRSWGVTPAMVAGHSVGEIAAAQVAGVLSLADAVRLVAARGRLMQALPGGGAMASIAASEAEVASELARLGVATTRETEVATRTGGVGEASGGSRGEGVATRAGEGSVGSRGSEDVATRAGEGSVGSRGSEDVATRAGEGSVGSRGSEDVATRAGEGRVGSRRSEDVATELAGRVAIAAVNGPRQVVVAGDAGAVEAVCAEFVRRGVQTRGLRVSHAFHSPRMEPMLAEFRREIAGLGWRAPALTMVSGVTGRVVGAEVATAEYWVRQARETVRFADVVATLHAAGVRTFVEAGPRAALLGAVAACLPEVDVALVPSLRAGQEERATALAAVGAVWANGGAVRWAEVLGPGRRVRLPTYAWQRERHWLDAPEDGRTGEATGHPLLGVKVPAAGVVALFEASVSLASHAWLGDHRVAGRVVVPGAALVELVRAALAGAAETSGVRGLVLLAPMVVPEEGTLRVQVVVSEEEGGTATVFSQPGGAPGGTGWTKHATARAGEVVEAVAAVELAAARERCAVEVDPAEMYGRFAGLGIAYGAEFRGVRSLRVGAGEALAEVTTGLRGGFAVAPTLLDAGLQAVLAALPEVADEGLRMPFAIERFDVHRGGATSAWAHVRLREGSGEAADVVLVDADGSVIAEVVGLRLQPADRAALRRGAAAGALMRRVWRAADVAEARAPELRWVIVGESRIATGLGRRLGGVVTSVAGLAEALAGATSGAGLGRRVGVIVVGGDAEVAVSRRFAVGDAEVEGSLQSAVGDDRGVAGSGRSAVGDEGEVAGSGRSAVGDEGEVAGSGRSAVGDEGEVAGSGCVVGDEGEAAVRGAVEGLRTVQAVLGSGGGARVWWVTRGAVKVAEEDVAAMAAAPVWGIARTVMLEHPELEGVLIDVGADADDAVIAAVVRELGAGDGEEQVAWRGGVRSVARLERVGVAAGDGPEVRGTVVVTGGLGALGLHAARWLAERGAQHVVLVGRRGLATPGASEAIAEIEATGARVTVEAIDVADRAALAAMLRRIPEALPLRGVVHAAGVIEDGVIGSLTAAGTERVFAPKVLGAWHLDALTEEAELDFFVMFSSLAGVLGSAGQANYAAANCCLDALAERRRGMGKPAQSVAWGAWTDGLAAGLQARLGKVGMGVLTPAQGVALLAEAMARPEALLVAGAREPRVERAKRASGPRWSERLAGLSAARRIEVVRAAVVEEVARVLGGERVAVDRPLQELGLDSLMAVELRGALGLRFGANLPATLAFDHPTVEALTRWLLGTVLGGAGEVVKEAAVVAAEVPIAIVGFGCRLPGDVVDAGSYWRLLAEGREGISEVPRERWDADAIYDPDPEATGTSTSRRGGFLTGIEWFDAGFFGISPREAVRMDPQQRLLLETGWEALEHAGIAPDSLMGSDTGVFVGLMYQEYGARVDDLAALDGYVSTGGAASVASGRLAYVLGLKGPCMTVDTACSSSLVTVHLACQALRRGECSLALAGGAAVMLTPTVFVEFSRLRGLAADGRCKSFSAAADGVGWSEGCGVVVLKRLPEALRDGDMVLGVIRGSAVNQDGRSNGLTAPNGPSQSAVIRRALADAGVEAGSLDYVECHGTGTALGDPIEARALGEVVAGRSGKLWIGSAKSNLGHTQAAAGVAGIIKVVLALGNERIPRSLHFDVPSPHVDWEGLKIAVAAEAVAWPRGGRPRRAGVSSFGVSGTNAHVVIEEGPAREARSGVGRSAELFVLSARDETALAELAGRLRARVEDEALALGDVALSLAVGRSAMDRRLAIVAGSRAELVAGLASAGSVGRAVGEGRPRVVFVFPGQGGQWVGMGRQLLAEEPAFRAGVEACDRAIAAEVGWSVVAELEAPAERSRLDVIDVVQPVLFAVEVGLAALWRAWGIEPDAVVGHSMGEVAAAYVAGALTLEDAARVICRRSRVLREIAGAGAMAVVELDAAGVSEVLRGFEDRLGVAACNGPRSTVIAGEPTALAEVLARLTAQQVFCRQVKVDVASHSPQVDRLGPGLLAALGVLRPRATQIVMRSTVTEAEVAGEELTAEYWLANVRRPVRFAGAIAGLIAEGCSVFVEMSPHPVLTPAVAELLTAAGRTGLAVGSQRRGQDERRGLLESLGAVWMHGGAPAWGRVMPPGARRVALPTYPWQRSRYWVEAPDGEKRGGHPLLGEGRSLSTVAGVRLWETRLAAGRPRWLADHQVAGVVMLPGAGFVEMALAGGTEALGGAVEAAEVELIEGLVVGGSVQVQLVTTAEAGGLRFQVASRAGEDAWTVHARGVVRRVSEGGRGAERGSETVGREAERGSEGGRGAERGSAVGAGIDVEAVQRRLGAEVAAEVVYAGFAGRGLAYGAAFRGITRLWRGAGEALALVRLRDPGDAGRCTVHPALLDACFQAAGAAFEDEATWLPVAVGAARVWRRPVGALWCHARLGAQTGARRAADLTVVDAAGRTVITVTGLVVQRVAERRSEADGWFIANSWERAAPNGSGERRVGGGVGERAAANGGEARRVSAGDGGVGERAAANGGEERRVSVGDGEVGERAAGRSVIVGDGGGVGERLAAALGRMGHAVVHAGAGGRWPVDDGDPASLKALLGDVFGGAAPTAVIHVGGCEAGGTIEAGLRRGVDSVLSTVQAIVGMGWRDAPRLWVVTRGAQALGGPVACEQAPSLGLARVVAMEHPELRCGRVDLDPRGDADEAGALAREIVGDDAEEEVALREGGRFVGRLVRRAPEASVSAVSGAGAGPGGVSVGTGSGGVSVGTGGVSVGTGGVSVGTGAGGVSLGTGGVSVGTGAGGVSGGTGAGGVSLGTGGVSVGTGAVRMRGDRSYLITGGLGGLGLAVAGWLAERGAGGVVLVGRGGVVDDGQRAAIAAIEARGVRVTVARADVAQRGQVAAVLAEVAGSGLPLAGVVHAAGVLDDGMLVDMDRGRLRTVMAPKILGALHLDELTRGSELELFVLFGSAAGLLGAPGQGNYAAANAFLDALAHRRRADGLAGLCVDWGAFAEVGLAVGEGSRLASRGLGSMRPADGLAALERLLAAGATQMAVLPIDVRQWVEFFPAAAGSRRLARLLADAPERAATAAGLRARVMAASGAERAALLVEFVRGEAGRVLRLAAEELPGEAPLTGLGMDSLMGLELRNRIEAGVGLRIPATLLWTYPTVAALAGHLAELLGGAAEVRAPVAVAEAKTEEEAVDEDGLLELLGATLARARGGRER